MLSVPPEWAQAKAEIIISAMAASVFLIFISQRCLKRQALTGVIFCFVEVERTRKQISTMCQPVSLEQLELLLSNP